MGKTPAQENRLKAKKAGMSHEKMKEEMANDVRNAKKLKNKEKFFCKVCKIYKHKNKRKKMQK